MTNRQLRNTPNEAITLRTLGLERGEAGSSSKNHKPKPTTPSPGLTVTQEEGGHPQPKRNPTRGDKRKPKEQKVSRAVKEAEGGK